MPHPVPTTLTPSGLNAELKNGHSVIAGLSRSCSVLGASHTFLTSTWNILLGQLNNITYHVR